MSCLCSWGNYVLWNVIRTSRLDVKLGTIVAAIGVGWKLINVQLERFYS